MRWQKPLVYQEFNGRRTEIAGAYRLDDGALAFQAKSSHRIGFELAAYDRSQPLVIDPVLVYSTYLGGSGFDPDGFVTILNPEGAEILFSTFWGGTHYESFRSVALDPVGNIYLAGATAWDERGVNTDFPIHNALQPQCRGFADAEVVKLTAGGTDVVYSTYILSWPIGATNFVLEATTSLSTVSWTTVTNTPTVSANERSVQLPLTGNTRFFRLRQP